MFKESGPRLVETKFQDVCGPMMMTSDLSEFNWKKLDDVNLMQTWKLARLSVLFMSMEIYNCVISAYNW